MAHVNMRGTHVFQGVTTAQVREGAPVVFASSGNWNDLPHVAAAPSGTVLGVYAAIIPPDNFPRPTPDGMFTARHNSTIWYEDATEDAAVQEARTFWKIGPSVLENPLIPSGWKVQLHGQGSVITLGSGAFVNNANIRTVGANVGVGAGGLWAHTATASEAIAKVREYRDGKLTIVLY